MEVTKLRDQGGAEGKKEREGEEVAVEEIFVPV